jgi:hypothetical protein
LPESYLLLFFSPTFFLHHCSVQPFEILREIAVNIFRVLRADSPTHYRFNIWIFRWVTSNVNKPAPCWTICHLARKCSTAGSSYRDARSVQLPGRLIAQRNKVQIFRVDLLESWVAKKTHRERKLRDSVGDRRAGGRCRKSRAANHVRSVRDPQSSLWVDCRTPWRLSSGAASLRGRRGDRKIYRTATVYRFAVVEKPLVI